MYPCDIKGFFPFMIQATDCKESVLVCVARSVPMSQGNFNIDRHELYDQYENYDILFHHLLFAPLSYWSFSCFNVDLGHRRCPLSRFALRLQFPPSTNMATSVALRASPTVDPLASKVKTNVSRKVQHGNRPTKALKSIPQLRPQSSRLTEQTWNRIQTTVIDANNLRTTTRLVLSFFMDHEVAQAHSDGNAMLTYPVVVPISEVYTMFAPRKRRSYDVLHVLEGVGILKRARGVDQVDSGFHSGHYLFYGKYGLLERVRAIQALAKSVIASTLFQDPLASRATLDERLFEAITAQAKQERWPDLVSTTMSLLSLLLDGTELTESNHSLVQISARLVDSPVVPLARDASGSSSVRSDVHRRVYDVVSVLANLNAVSIAKGGDRLVPSDGEVRPRSKQVTFNEGIFSNANLIRVGDICSARLEKILKKEANQVVSGRRNRKQLQKVVTECVRLPPLAREPFEDPTLEDLFPSSNPVFEGDERMVEWWNVPLRDLLLQDALQGIDFLDWEIMQAISRARDLHSERAVAPTIVNSQDADITDLTCDERLDPSIHV